jgi:hypothetical protein
LRLAIGQLIVHDVYMVDYVNNTWHEISPSAVEL